MSREFDLLEGVKSNLPSTALTLPEGEYWITDPCYAYPDKEWTDFCQQIPDETPGMVKYGDHEFYAWSTAYGDGEYLIYGPWQGSAGVDSGMLAIIPDDLIRKWRKAGKMKEYMKRGLACYVVLECETPIEFDNGNVAFGEHEVVTDGSDCEEDDEGDS